MSQSVLSVRMDQETKDAFARFCDEAGLSVSAAVTLFARQTVRNQAIPFSITLHPLNDGTSVSPVSSSGQTVLSLASIRSIVESVTPDFPAIQSVILFGSYARGEATPRSDVDLRVRHDCAMKFSLIDLSSYYGKLESLFGKAVDIVSVGVIEDQTFAKTIEREGIVLYERKK